MRRKSGRPRHGEVAQAPLRTVWRPTARTARSTGAEEPSRPRARSIARTLPAPTPALAASTDRPKRVPSNEEHFLPRGISYQVIAAVRPPFRPAKDPILG